jgi:hypothetical protein
MPSGMNKHSIGASLVRRGLRFSLPSPNVFCSIRKFHIFQYLGRFRKACGDSDHVDQARNDGQNKPTHSRLSFESRQWSYIC